MPPKVLFLCTANSCRSQMAEGWTRSLYRQSIEPYSAGTRSSNVNPLAIQVMAESGIDISRHSSKDLQSLSHIHFDLVVTVCHNAAAACPIGPTETRSMHVPFDDPPELAKHAQSEAEVLNHYRRVRDEIQNFILLLPKHLSLPDPHPTSTVG